MDGMTSHVFRVRLCVLYECVAFYLSIVPLYGSYPIKHKKNQTQHIRISDNIDAQSWLIPRASLYGCYVIATSYCSQLLFHSLQTLAIDS